MPVRATSAFRITAPRSPAVMLESAPRNLPTGVRIGETMAARFIGFKSLSFVRKTVGNSAPRRQPRTASRVFVVEVV